MSCHCAATPPTPDLDAVVARVREYLETYSWAADNRTVDRLGNDDDALFVGDLRALLAAVSRPAEARGERARAARRQAHDLCREMMICASPQGTDEAPYAAWIRAQFPEFYPATGEEPMRDALHAGTDKAAERLAVTEAWMRGKCLVSTSTPSDGVVLNGDNVARDIAALLAEVERLRAKAAIVDAIDSGAIDCTDYADYAPHRIGILLRDGKRWFHGPTLAAAFRAAQEGTDNA